MKFGFRFARGTAAFIDGRTRVAVLALAAAMLVAACGSTNPSLSPPQAAPSSVAPPPTTITVSPATATVAVGGTSVSFSATGSGAASGVTWQVNGVAGGDGTLGTISASGAYTSPAVVPSPATVTISALSVDNPTDYGSATVTLTNPPPQVSVAVTPTHTTVAAGSGTQLFVATVTNATNTAVTWSVNGVTGGNTTVGTISTGGLYTAPTTPPAQPTVQITAVSVQDPTQSASATLTVATLPPAAPTISGTPPTTVQATQPYLFQPTASSPSGATLTFSITNKPAWATFSTTSGQLSGTPAASAIGAYSSIIVAVSDGTTTVSLPAFTITVQPAPPPPTISGAPPTTVKATQAYLFQPTVADPSGAALTFSIVNKPSWAIFATQSGQLSGTPSATAVGSYANITISVSDGTTTVPLPAFTITVLPVPPTISGAPATSVTAGQAYSFQPTASSPSGAALTFSIANPPSWATFATQSGLLSGTPPATAVGSYANITISVSDGTTTVPLPAFTIAVLPVPPTISGTPATSVMAGQPYSFTPVASSPRGGLLTFSIANQPTWATFNATSGQLSGTPPATAVGNYSNITISVNDGTATASLPPFTITVQASVAPTNYAFTWTGVADARVTGYRVYWSTAPFSSGTAPTTVDVGNVTSFPFTRVTLGNLASGTTVYMSVAALGSGLESPLTSPVSTAIN